MLDVVLTEIPFISSLFGLASAKTIPSPVNRPSASFDILGSFYGFCLPDSQKGHVGLPLPTELHYLLRDSTGFRLHIMLREIGKDFLKTTFDCLSKHLQALTVVRMIWLSLEFCN